MLDLEAIANVWQGSVEFASERWGAKGCLWSGIVSIAVFAGVIWWFTGR